MRSRAIGAERGCSTTEPNSSPQSTPVSYALPLRRSGRLCSVAALPLAVFFALAGPLHAQDFSHPDTQPSPQAALIQKANDALAAGDFVAALKILTDLNTQSPNNPQVLYNLGLTSEALEPTAPDATRPTAESYYRKAIAVDPRFPTAHVALGLLLARTNRATEAHAELTTATTLPDADHALKARAFRALAKLDQQATPPNPPAASAELLAALQLSPEQPDDVLLSAQIAAADADLPAAEQAYRRYLALPEAAGDTQATADLAHILLAERHADDAEALLVSALANSPDNPSFTAQLAEAYVLSGDAAKMAQATPLVEALHARNPDNPSITRLLAHVYLETGHSDLADPLYAGLIAAQTTHPDPTLLDDRAEALLHLHRPGEAEKLLKQAIANPVAFPTAAALGDATLHLAFAAEGIDDPRTTLQALSLRATVQPPTPSSLFLEATANDELHQNSKAVELYTQFLVVANGSFPDQESQARQRLTALGNRK
jgi:predicted Zn-dependent protease